LEAGICRQCNAVPNSLFRDFCGLSVTPVKIKLDKPGGSFLSLGVASTIILKNAVERCVQDIQTILKQGGKDLQ